MFKPAKQQLIQDTLAVPQRCIAITNPKEKFSKLAPYGADPCVIVSVYNTKTKTLLMAHVDSVRSLSSLENYIKTVTTADKAVILNAYLRGSNSFFKILLSEIATLLNRLCISISLMKFLSSSIRIKPP